MILGIICEYQTKNLFKRTWNITGCLCGTRQSLDDLLDPGSGPILDKIKLIGDGPQSLFYIDKEVDGINAAAEKAEAQEEQ